MNIQEQNDVISLKMKEYDDSMTRLVKQNSLFECFFELFPLLYNRRKFSFKEKYNIANIKFNFMLFFKNASYNALYDGLFSDKHLSSAFIELIEDELTSYMGPQFYECDVGDGLSPQDSMKLNEFIRNKIYNFAPLSSVRIISLITIPVIKLVKMVYMTFVKRKYQAGLFNFPKQKNFN